jgi:hypothetical protein
MMKMMMMMEEELVACRGDDGDRGGDDCNAAEAGNGDGGVRAAVGGSMLSSFSRRLVK